MSGSRIRFGSPPARRRRPTSSSRPWPNWARRRLSRLGPMSSTHRTARLSRQTSESSIELTLDLDGTGGSDIQTTVPFYDHLLTAFAKHALVDLTVRAEGATEIDVH